MNCAIDVNNNDTEADTNTEADTDTDTDPFHGYLDIAEMLVNESEREVAQLRFQ